MERILAKQVKLLTHLFFMRSIFIPYADLCNHVMQGEKEAWTLFYTLSLR